MRNIRHSILMLVIFASFIVGCDKPVYKYNPDFEGIWRTLPQYDSILNYSTLNEIVINGSDGSYKSTCTPCGSDLCNCIVTQAGKAVMNDSKTQMRMGSNGYALTIEEEPNVDINGEWTMKVQGFRYYKQ